MSSLGRAACGKDCTLHIFFSLPIPLGDNSAGDGTQTLADFFCGIRNNVDFPHLRVCYVYMNLCLQSGINTGTRMINALVVKVALL